MWSKSGEKSILVRLSGSFELPRVRVIQSIVSEVQKITCKLLCREDLKYCVTQKRIIKHNSPKQDQNKVL